jgi:6-phosphogluconolactonase (cycloisomerase 2 family)
MTIIVNEKSRAKTSYGRYLPLLLLLTALAPSLRAQTDTDATSFNFTLAASPASATVLQGQGINYVVTGASITGGDNVNLTVSGLPAGASATFSSNPLVVPPGSSGSSGMFVTADNSTATGSYILTITGTSASTGLSKSTTVTWIVQEATTTVLSASALFQHAGQPVTLTATVSAPSGRTPIGFIYFRDSGALLARVPLSGGVATFTTSTLVGGDHSLDAHYGGNVKFATSTSPLLPLFFFGKPTDTVLAFSPAVFGVPLTITATVTGAGPIPTGTVIFKDRTRTLGTGVLDGTGTAQITTSATELEGGSQHVMTAIYSGDLVYESDIESVPLTVGAAGATTVLSSSLNPSPDGSTITLTATVSGPGTPLGFIYFRDGGALLARVQLSGGVATFATSGLVGGTHSLDAHYGGNLSWNTSTSPVLTQVVNGMASTATLAFNPAAPIFGQPVTMTATVSGAGPTPTGNVTFMDGTATLGTSVLVTGTAQFTTTITALAGGSHTITAIYGGDLTYNGSSVSVPLTVSPAATTTTLSSSLNPSTNDTSVTFTAQVTGPGSPIGSIDFRRDGGIVMATVPLSTTCCGGSVATFTTSTLTHGTHSIDAHYSGNLSWNPSTSAVLEQVVNGPRSGFVYVASSPGVSGYAVDAALGFLTPVVGSPFLSLGEPDGLAATPAGQFLYVASRDANSVLAYAIDGAGGLTPVPGSPFPIPGGISPRSVAVDPTGHFAYVTNGNSNNISAFTIDAGTGALTPVSGSPFPSAPHPAAIAVTPDGRFAYVATLDPGNSVISGYTIDSSTGALTPLAGSPFPTGGFSIAVDPTGRFAYVADGANVLAYTINGTTGALTPAPGSPYPQQAISVAVDPKGQFVYVTDEELSNTVVVGYTIDATTGALTQLAGPSFPTATGPLSITVDLTGKFVYVVNTGINSVSAYAINRSSGVLTPVAGSPFPTEFGSRFVIHTLGPSVP